MKIVIALLEEWHMPFALGIVEKIYGKAPSETIDVCDDDLRDMFSNAKIKPTFFVALVNNEVVGFIGMNDPRSDYGTQVVFWAMVDPEMQNKGIGKALVKRVIKTAKEMPGIHCLILTTCVPEYFKRYKFKIIQKLRHDEVRMTLCG